jgi:site-specific recombinase XerD
MRLDNRLCTPHIFGLCVMDLGISLEVISELMGHTDTKATRIYDKIRKGLKIREMKKCIKWAKNID